MLMKARVGDRDDDPFARERSQTVEQIFGVGNVLNDLGEDDVIEGGHVGKILRDHLANRSVDVAKRDVEAVRAAEIDRFLRNIQPVARDLLLIDHVLEQRPITDTEIEYAVAGSK